MKSSSWIRAKSWSVEHMRSCSPAAGIMRNSIGGSCWKKSWRETRRERKQGEESLGKAYDSRLMRRLITYLRPYKRYVVLALVLILFESSLEVTFPWLTKIAIDQYIKAANIAGLGTIAIIYVVLLLVRFVCASDQKQ